MKCTTKWSDVRIADISMQKQRRWIRFVQENKDAEKLSRKVSADGQYRKWARWNMRLIDADALKFDIMCVYGSNPQYIRWLNHAPTVDAIPVVRCKDCKWWREDSDHTCKHFYTSPKVANDFCSYAEPKETS